MRSFAFAGTNHTTMMVSFRHLSASAHFVPFRLISDFGTTASCVGSSEGYLRSGTSGQRVVLWSEST